MSPNRSTRPLVPTLDYLAIRYIICKDLVADHFSQEDHEEGREELGIQSRSTLDRKFLRRLKVIFRMLFSHTRTKLIAVFIIIGATH